jgi:BNR repeat-like domain
MTSARILLACTLAAFAYEGVAHEKQAAEAVRHVFVYKEPGRFAAWPANNGIWMWQEEILVGFTLGYHKADDEGHSIDGDRPARAVLARSLDGGETWKIEDPENFVGDGGTPAPSPGGMDFGNPNLAIRLGGPPPYHQEGTTFFVSGDRGRTWRGPYLFSGLEKLKLTARTDYLIGPRDALLFLSADQPGVKAGNYQDRAFVARAIEGGRSFEFVSWITKEPHTTRSVMPSSARVSNREIVTALRRRDDSNATRRNWIDLHASTDNGATWELRSKVADTDRPDTAHNGNPPALVRLRDGRIVVTYGYRSKPYGIRARISRDVGKTWGPEIVLRGDGATWDLGYSRSVQRSDGKVVTIYYFTTAAHPEQHIAATIWDPDSF